MKASIGRQRNKSTFTSESPDKPRGLPGRDGDRSNRGGARSHAATRAQRWCPSRRCEPGPPGHGRPRPRMAHMTRRPLWSTPWQPDGTIAFADIGTVAAGGTWTIRDHQLRIDAEEPSPRTQGSHHRPARLAGGHSGGGALIDRRAHGPPAHGSTWHVRLNGHDSNVFTQKFTCSSSLPKSLLVERENRCF